MGTKLTGSMGMLVLGVVTAAGCGGQTVNSSDASGVDTAVIDASGSDSSGDATADVPATCSPACGASRACCAGACANLDNDPLNCGACGVTCGGSTPYCDGTCKALPCTRPGAACADGGACCGSACCATGQICCKTEGPIGGPPECFTPTSTQKSCPAGCAPLCKSDRDEKRDVVPVHDKAVLDALTGVPMSTWSYTTDSPSVRHLGPMAQDFSAAFGVGATDRAYDPIDAHGVAFSSIKALYEMVKEQDRRIQRLEDENALLRSRATKGDACGR